MKDQSFTFEQAEQGILPVEGVMKTDAGRHLSLRNRTSPNVGHRGRASKRGAIVGRDRLTWRARDGRWMLFHRSDRRPIAVVESDANWPGLFRIRYPDGHVSDVVNLTRAKNAAAVFALRCLNSKSQESAADRVTKRLEATRVPEQGRALSRASGAGNGMLAVDAQEA